MNYFNIPINLSALIPVAKIKMLLSDAFHEGFKQNFLGYDIDMDFVTLSLQVYALMIVLSVKDGAKSISRIYKTAISKIGGNTRDDLKCCLN